MFEFDKNPFEILSDLAKSQHVCPDCGHNPCTCKEASRKEKQMEKPKKYSPPAFAQGGYKQGGYHVASKQYHQGGYKQGGYKPTHRSNNASKGLSGLTDLAKAQPPKFNVVSAVKDASREAFKNADMKPRVVQNKKNKQKQTFRNAKYKKFDE